MKRAVQYFTKEYLEQCSNMKAEERLEFLDNFRQLSFAAAQNPPQEKQTPPSKAICIKMPQDLLQLLKLKASQKGIPYQSYMKQLLRQAIGQGN